MPKLRFGSKADMTPLDWDVCFTPESGRRGSLNVDVPHWPLRAFSQPHILAIP